MPTPARILCAEASNLDRTQPHFGPRDIERRERIVAIGQSLMANHGRHNITFANLALALLITSSALRRHFADLDALLAEILRRHLLALSQAIGEIPMDAPNRPALMRQAYLDFTRTPLGGLTEAHLLLTRDARLLPNDERIPIEDTHRSLGDVLGGQFARETLVLLDAPYIEAQTIETMLTALQQPAPASAKVQPKQLALMRSETMPPVPPTPEPSTPGSWIFTAGLPERARAPPAAKG